MRELELPGLLDTTPHEPAPGEIGEVIEFAKMPDDGVVLQAIRPKTAMLIPAADAAVSGDIKEQFKVSMRLIRDLLTPESRDYLFNRLSDPADKLDIEHLRPIIDALVEALGGRPTGSGSD
jgi:hypothetical protein